MYTILICDDQQDIVNALKIYLTPEGYRLLEANNGQQALEILREEEVHLVLLDIMMPKMDGITATAKIREFSNVPIILLTAKSENEDKVLGLNVGADADITIFDFDAISDRATFPEPALAPVGIDYVLIGGQIAANDCQIVNHNCGSAVRK